MMFYPLSFGDCESAWCIPLRACPRTRPGTVDVRRRCQIYTVASRHNYWNPWNAGNPVPGIDLCAASRVSRSNRMVMNV